jgi:transcriptional regulator with XRE-family HTH domain
LPAEVQNGNITVVLSLSYEKLASEFLRALRGSRSQLAFSRRLRYKSNVSYLWEARRKWPTAAVAMWAAERVGIDPLEAVTRFYKVAPEWLGDESLTSPEGIARFLDDLRGSTSILELAERCGRSRYAVARWLKGQTEPRLPDFFRLIEAASSRLLDFLACFVDPHQLPAARKAWQRLSAARQLMSEMPWSPAILLMLEVEDYRALPEHQPGWLAERIGISLEVEEQCLEALATTGQIRMVRSRWEPANVQTIDTRVDPALGRSVKGWWSDAGARRIHEGAPGLFSFNVFTISQSDLLKLEEMQRAYYRAMRSMIAASTPAERVVVTNLHLFPVDGRALRG